VIAVDSRRVRSQDTHAVELGCHMGLDIESVREW
jgi:hypothetical protein